jgi:hypothetical protein
MTACINSITPVYGNNWFAKRDENRRSEMMINDAANDDDR